LEAQIRAESPTWFGYAIEAIAKSGDSCQSGRYLEGNGRSDSFRVVSSSPVFLEGSRSIAILYRVSSNNVSKIEVYPLSCALDAGSLPFIWLTGVPQEASLSFLQKRNSDDALFAISQHAGSRALDMLIEMAKQDPSTHLREQALFWLAQRAGERAVTTITNAILNDPDTEVKKKAVFALSQLPKDEGVPKLIDVARTQRNPEVRKQAFFWLGQSHDARALAFIQQVLTQ
jgi:hypothetical protein